MAQFVPPQSVRPQSVPPGDLLTQPATKIVFNAPYDLNITQPIRIVNSGNHRILWAVEGMSADLSLQAGQPNGVLGPGESALISGDAFHYGRGNANGYIYIKWMNSPQDTTEQHSNTDPFSEDGVAIRHKNLPVEYNY